MADHGHQHDDVDLTSDRSMTADEARNAFGIGSTPEDDERLYAAIGAVLTGDEDLPEAAVRRDLDADRVHRVIAEQVEE